MNATSDVTWQVDQRHFAQAKLLAELAQRIEDPIDALPPGDVTELLLTLRRDATRWALASLSSVDARDDLAGLWNSASASLIEKAAGGAMFVPSFKNLLLPPPDTSVVAPPERAHARQLGTFLARLLICIDEPRRRKARGRIRRWVALLSAACLASVGVWMGLNLALARPDLATGGAYRTSSQLASCRDRQACGNAFFHTLEEDNPWIEFDLRQPMPLTWRSRIAQIAAGNVPCPWSSS